MREEDIAEQFLRARDFTCDHNLNWLGGDTLKPDFFCQGPFDMWVEVKTLRSEESEREYLHRMLDDLKRRTSAGQTIGRGWAMAFVSQEATQRDAKTSLALARQAFSLPEMQTMKNAYLIVPDDPIYGHLVHFTVSGRDGPSLFVCTRSESGVYGHPFSFQPHPWDQRISVWANGVAGSPLQWHEVLRDGSYRLALRVIPEDKNFHVASVMRAEGATRSTTVDRLRGAIKTAAKQLKHGMTVRPGPGAVFLYHSGILAAEEREILIALFGDLQMTFVGGKAEGKLHYGPNGIINASKHRSVSAVTYFLPNGLPLTIHNPWARVPLPQRLFGGKEFVPEDEGTFRVIGEDVPAAPPPA